MSEFKFYITILCYCTSHSVNSIIVHPTASLISIISSISIPVQELQAEYRTLFDWCFQMSFDLPSKLTSLYNTPIWAAKLHRSKRNYLLKNDEQENNRISFKSLKYENIVPNKRAQHFSDFSAGELYQALEDFLMSLGFHETCLMHAVCELARRPFADQKNNIVTNILTFILSPSLHKGFNEHDHLYKDLYETAELYGSLNEDCTKIYDDCRYNSLSDLTKVIIN